MRISRVLLTTTLAAACIALAAPAAHADSTGTGALPTISVAYSVGDIAFDGHANCPDVPVTLTFTKSGPVDQIGAIVSVTVQYDGKVPETFATEYIGPDQGASGTVTVNGSICPGDIRTDSGPLLVGGTITGGNMLEADQVATLSTSPATFALNPSTLAKQKSVRSGNSVRLSGTAMAQTPSKGAVAAEGSVRIETKPRGAKTWTLAGTTKVDALGGWESKALNGKRYPKGTAFRATLTNCGWCTDATATATIR